MADFLKPYTYLLEAILIAVCVALFASGIHKYNDWIREPLVAQLEKERADNKAQSDKIKADTDLKSAQARADVAAIRSDTNAQITVLAGTVSRLSDSLRQRPDRPSQSDLPGNPADGAGVTGATGLQLYRRDGEFLARFAGDTTRLQLELKKCYAQYAVVEKAYGAVSKSSK